MVVVGLNCGGEGGGGGFVRKKKERKLLMVDEAAMGESDEDDHGNNVYQLSVIHITVGWKGIDIGVYPIGN